MIDPVDDEPVGDSGGPYKEVEIRHGPPLPYLGEKIETAIGQSCFLLRHIDLIPKDIPLPEGFPPSCNIRDDFVESPARMILHDSLKAFLGLYDLLEWWSPELVDRLAKSTGKEVQAFIQKVWKEGNPSGTSWPRGEDLE